jgi:hypothetical protein
MTKMGKLRPTIWFVGVVCASACGSDPANSPRQGSGGSGAAALQQDGGSDADDSSAEGSAAGGGGGDSGACRPSLPFPDHVVGHLAEGSNFANTVFREYLYTADGAWVKIYSVDKGGSLKWNTPTDAQIYTRGPVMGLFAETDAEHDYLYIAATSEFLIVDITNPHSPCLLGHFPVPSSFSLGTVFLDVKAHGRYAYLAGWDTCLIVVDISDKSNPRLAASWKTSANSRRLELRDGYVYIGAGSSLHILDVSDPADPHPTGTPFSTQAVSGKSPVVSSVAVRDDGLAFVVNYGSGIDAVDITDKAAPVSIGHWDGIDGASDIALSGQSQVYVSTRYHGFDVLDYQYDPNTKSVTMSVSAQGKGPTTWAGYIEDIAVSPKYTFVSSQAAGLGVYDMSQPLDNPVSVLNVVGAVWCMKIVDDKYLYIGPRDGGVWIADVSDRTRPRIINYVEPPWGRWYAMLDRASHLFLTGASGMGWLTFLDISQRTQPHVVKTGLRPPARPGLSPKGALLDGASLLYGSSDADNASAFLTKVNVADPANPSDLLTSSTPAWGIAKYGNYYIATGTDTIHAVDPASLAIVGSTPAQPQSHLYASVAVVGSTAYVGAKNAIEAYSLVTLPEFPTSAPDYQSLKYPGRWTPADITADSTRVYATGGKQVKIFSLVDSSHPTFAEIATYSVPFETRPVEVSADHIFVGSDQSEPIGAAGVVILAK